MKTTKFLLTKFLVKALLLTLCFWLCTTWNLASANTKQQTNPLLLALKDFNFEQFHSNFGDIKTISFDQPETKPDTNKEEKAITVAKKTKNTSEENKISPVSRQKIPEIPNIVEPEVILAQSSPAPSSTPITAPAPTQASAPVPPPPPQRQATPTQYSQPRTTAPYTAPISSRPPAIGSANSPYAFHSYRLSYMQSDRTMALLKALGYSTVEYSAGRGESVNESIFTAFQQSYTYPIIVKVLDAAKTSLMQPSLDGGYNPASATDRLSGTYLHQSTTGAPEQRLLIVYEKQYPEQLNTLLNLLRSEVDVAASQIVIEALVIEIDTNKAQELGLKYNLVGKNNNTSINEGISSSFQSNQRSLFGWNSSRVTGTYSTPVYDAYGNYISSTPTAMYGALERTNPLGFTAELKASIADGSAEVLSNPTILVLDGRQALIRIGTQIPNKTVVQTNYGSTESVTYIDTGIVLNIRPRISEDGSEVTMQTETIVSTSRPYLNKDDNPPEIESKTVQSFVRVSDNTPFIIGGLIEKDKTDGFTGVPILSSIPVLGNLFKSTTKKEGAREVIIVITPHIINT
ncbi:MAG: hypothetical protein VW576_09375, partial [Opitutae bacterium]